MGVHRGAARLRARGRVLARIGYPVNSGLKKIIAWGGIAFLIFFIAFRPGAAGEAVATLGAVAVDILTGVGDFFNGLVS